MIRVGLAGAGPWAGMFHAPMLAGATGLTLSAVWARRREAAEDLARQYGAEATATFDQLLERCDAVVFSVPPDVQAALAPLAARAGRHLLLEKPLARTVAAAEAIAAAADAAGVATQLMLTYRFTAPVREFLHSLAGAPVRYVHTAWIGGGALPGSPFATPWRRDAGAVLLDLGPHTLDLAEAAAGPVTGLRAAERGGVVTVTTEHAGGATGQVALSGTTPLARGPLEAEAVTDAGRFVLADPTPQPPDAVWHTITDEFVRTVQRRFTQPIDVHRGVRIQRLLAAVADSIATGEPAPVGRS
jgi:predicted dehydrogenase